MSNFQQQANLMLITKLFNPCFPFPVPLFRGYSFSVGFVFFCFFLEYELKGQAPNYTANTRRVPYLGGFRAGVNFDIYRGFADEDLARLAAGDKRMGIKGLGMKTLRPALFEAFTENYGYDIRLPAFQLYDSLNLKENTLIVGFPSEQHRDPNFYCPQHQSTVFKNMYAPIWDNGENGTPVNDSNYYALYIWKIATKYKKYVRFYEVWNEPGFDYTGSKGWLPRGSAGNWWENNPEPCDYKLRAPIFNYVRLLRISYEVIKSVDSTAYVVTSGLGYPSFLDAILRNTDNPQNGSVNAQFPLKGGAYLDGLGYHVYPHFDDALRTWNNQTQSWDYARHSDQAASDPSRIKKQYEKVLVDYGYNGIQYPEKIYLATEINIPRKTFGDYIGSDTAQRNFIIKTMVDCARNGILQTHVFKIAEETSYQNAFSEFDVMGMYKQIHYTNKTQPTPTEMGIAYSSGSQVLFGKNYDSLKTRSLQLPSGVDGAAFRDSNNIFTYVLWAKTTRDRNENAQATYSFPINSVFKKLLKEEWSVSRTGLQSEISLQNIQLSATPVFLTELYLESSARRTCENTTLNFTDLTASVNRIWTVSDLSRNTSETFTTRVLNARFIQQGDYRVELTARQLSGELLVKQDFLVQVEKKPVANFTFEVQASSVVLKNRSSNNTDSLKWSFSDGKQAFEPDLTHFFSTSGAQTATLSAQNFCGTHSYSQTFTVVAPTIRVAKTANDTTPIYNEPFRAGVNLNFAQGWSDETLGDIVAGNLEKNISGLGGKSMRLQLPHYFTKFWGADVRQNTYRHFANLGLQDLMLTVSSPDMSVRDPNSYCHNKQSQLFKNMYTDIFDGGANGTPVNDSNYLARYIFDMVKTYKNEVKFWEIWNAPGQDIEGKNGWKPRNWQNNWWQNNPDPCELAIAAPIQHMVRMMRIAYEVIKMEDSSAMVVFSGAGFPSFLDAVCRNTDNPNDGSASALYPYGGGAYFDVVSFNAFPHIDGTLETYDPAVGALVFKRNSETAALGIEKNKLELETVLKAYGYNGRVFPKKRFVLGEVNVPRRRFSESWGGEIEQRNFIMKAQIRAAASSDILQMHIKSISDEAPDSSAVDGGQLMGLYQKLGAIPYDRSMNLSGIGFKTTNDLLFGLTYDSVRTQAMRLPSSVAGFAFRNKLGRFVYAVWAKSTIDKLEYAVDSFSFPTALNISKLYRFSWNHSVLRTFDSVASTRIKLAEVPQFLSEDSVILKMPVAAFTSDFRQACPDLRVNFQDLSTNAIKWRWNLNGGSPDTSSQKNPSIPYQTGGKFDVSLTASNAQGSHTVRKRGYVIVDSKPEADFNTSNDSLTIVQFNNTTTGSFSMIWDFGDNSPLDFTLTPRHRYAQRLRYTVKLIARNDCGNDTIVKIVDLRPVSTHDVKNSLNDINFQSFPNPFSEQISIRFTLEKAEKLSFDIFDLHGRKLMNLLENRTFSAGDYNENFPNLTLSAGFYILKITNADGESRLFNLVKM
jgi:PKD repeat protein